MNDPKEWARNIVRDWDAGTYPVKYRNAYEFACKTVGIMPKTHPTEVRKQAYRKDIHG